MSGPKRYEFYASSDEEAEEIVARFAAFSHGVRAYVRDGEIVVEQARYDNTMSFSEISAAVEKCRKKYREDERMRKLIAAEKERAAQEIRAAFDRARTAAAARVAEAKTELKRCETLKREMSRASYSTPFGDFSMRSRTGAIDDAMRDISSEISSAAAEKSRLDAAERAAVDAVYACDGLQAIERAERSGKAVSVPAPDASRRVDDIEEKLGEDRDRLKAFVGFLRSLDGMVERKGMSGYRDRLKNVVEGTDPFAAGAADAVAAAFEKMCAEEAYVREGEKVLRAERAAAAAGDEAARLSEEIAALLRPIRATEEVFADIRRANEERSDALIGKCESLLAELDAMRYRPKDRLMHTERLRKTIERCKKTRNMTVTPDILRRAASELALIGKEGAEEEKLYLAFAEAQGRFKRVYAEFCAATSGEGSAVDDQGDYLGSLAEEEFSPKRAGEQTAELEEVAARLADVVGEFRQNAFCSSMHTVCSDRGHAVFSTERKGRDMHVNYVRRGERGAMFDVTCAPDGSMEMFPRAVILHNGTRLLDADGLRRVHETCKWTDDIADAFRKMNFPPSQYEEIYGEARDALFTDEGCFRLETYEDSVRYLRLCGYSEEEIAALVGYAEPAAVHETESTGRHRAAARSRYIDGDR